MYSLLRQHGWQQPEMFSSATAILARREHGQKEKSRITLAIGSWSVPKNIPQQMNGSDCGVFLLHVRRIRLREQTDYIHAAGHAIFPKQDGVRKY